MGWEDPLEKEMATHSNNSCLENSMDREAWWATVPGVATVGHNLLTKQQQQVNVARLQLEKKNSYFDISFVGVLNMHKKQYIYT